MGLWRIVNGKAYRVKEYYHSGRETQTQLTDEEYYQALEKLTDGYKIDCIVIDPSAASFIACIRKHGKYNVRPAINDVIDGIRVTSTFLYQKKLFFSEDCPNTINEFTLYRWDDKAGEDKVIKENDHAMDDTRYFCKTILERYLR